MDDLIDVMASALQRFSTRQVEQPVRSVISVDGDTAFFGTMPAFVEELQWTAAGPASARNSSPCSAPTPRAGSTHSRRSCLDPETGALRALPTGAITEARTQPYPRSRPGCSRARRRRRWRSDRACRHGSPRALSRVHRLRRSVWSPNKLHRDQFVDTQKLPWGSDPKPPTGGPSGQTPAPLRIVVGVSPASQPSTTPAGGGRR